VFPAPSKSTVVQSKVACYDQLTLHLAGLLSCLLMDNGRFQLLLAADRGPSEIDFLFTLVGAINE
jgi:hypothetical protein